MLSLHAQSWKSVQSLEGNWKFEIGDDSTWNNPKLNDSKWNEIHVPSPWEDQGYAGYDGYAWYRKHFKFTGGHRGAPLYLLIGSIDDVGEVYLNGMLIGFSGKFPPDIIPGALNLQSYYIPRGYLIDGDNVIAVRVYDLRLDGGITHGPVGIYEPQNYIQPDLDLSGKWKFTTGDNMDWARESFDDSKWNAIVVPTPWETQGYREYDGFGWYRIKFVVPEHLKNERLTLLLGKIDDIDEVYLNGSRIGRTGKMRKWTEQADLSTEYLVERAYDIPTGLLHTSGENTIAVRVLDVWLHGGIYDGPIGIIRATNYQHRKKEPNSFWNFLRDFFTN
jgi:sialate O-acetylesterase